GLKESYGGLARRAAGVAYAVVVVVGEETARLPVQPNSFGPIQRSISCISIGYRRTLAEILAHIAVVTTRVQRCDHRLAVGPFPKAYVEWDTRRGVFGGVGAADPGSRTPCQLLRREPFNSAMCQDAGQGRGKTEAVRKHVLDTGLAELVAKPIVAVQDLTDDG